MNRCLRSIERLSHRLPEASGDRRLLQNPSSLIRDRSSNVWPILAIKYDAMDARKQATLDAGKKKASALRASGHFRPKLPQRELVCKPLAADTGCVARSSRSSSAGKPLQQPQSSNPLLPAPDLPPQSALRPPLPHRRLRPIPPLSLRRGLLLLDQRRRARASVLPGRRRIPCRSACIQAAQVRLSRCLQ